MKTYTVRFAHLKQMSGLRVGDKVAPYAPLGVMGNTGASNGAHLHLDVIEGLRGTQWRQADMDTGDLKAAPKQAAYFIDDALFGIAPVITTQYADPQYLVNHKKIHQAFDVVPEDRHISESHYAIWWNRSVTGTVVYSDFDDVYGYTLMISFER